MHHFVTSYIPQTSTIEHIYFYKTNDIAIDTNMDESNTTKKSAVTITRRRASSEKMTINPEVLCDEACITTDTRGWCWTISSSWRSHNASQLYRIAVEVSLQIRLAPVRSTDIILAIVD